MGLLNLGFKISTKKFLAAILVFSPSFAWLYLININLYQFADIVGEQNLQDWNLIFTGKTLFLLAIIIFAIIGSIISERIKRKQLLSFWILFGVLTTAAFPFFQGTNSFLIISILAGASFGIGFPSALAFVADSTTMEDRARVSGSILLVTYIILLAMIGITLQCESIESIFICSALRGISFFALFLDNFERVPSKKKTWIAILKTPGFSFYFLPWLLFMAAGGFSYFVETWFPQDALAEYEILAGIGIAFTYISPAITGLISGFVSDRYGRKYSIIVGLASLGISYAVLLYLMSPIIWLVTQIIYGAAWGIVFVNYYFTVIGDFSTKGSRERFYAIGGVVPLILQMTLQLFSEIYSISLPYSIVYALLSTLLWVAVILLFFAPETLRRDIIRQKKFKTHLKNVKKLVDDEDSKL